VAEDLIVGIIMKRMEFPFGGSGTGSGKGGTLGTVIRLAIGAVGDPVGAGDFDGDRQGNYVWDQPGAVWWSVNDPDLPPRLQPYVLNFGPAQLDQYHDPQRQQPPSPTYLQELQRQQKTEQKAYKKQREAWVNSQSRKDIGKLEKPGPFSRKSTREAYDKKAAAIKKKWEKVWDDYYSNPPDEEPTYDPYDRSPSPGAGPSGDAPGGMVPHPDAIYG
jgi:hypothetical protein